MSFDCQNNQNSIIFYDFILQVSAFDLYINNYLLLIFKSLIIF